MMGLLTASLMVLNPQAEPERCGERPKSRRNENEARVGVEVGGGSHLRIKHQGLSRAFESLCISVSLCLSLFLSLSQNYTFYSI
jgi:hypothetical protein